MWEIYEEYVENVKKYEEELSATYRLPCPRDTWKKRSDSPSDLLAEGIGNFPGWYPALETQQIIRS